AQRIAPRSDKRRAQPAAGEPQLPEILAICLTEDPPPSVAEVARRLNFRRAQTLWAREPQLCRQIAARHRDSRTIGHAAKHVYKAIRTATSRKRSSPSLGEQESPIPQ